MKIKIQLLAWDTQEELQSCVEQLSAYAGLLGVTPLQLCRLDSENIFVIQLPKDDQLLCWTVNALSAWAGLHQHSVQVMPDYYADEEF